LIVTADHTGSLPTIAAAARIPIDLHALPWFRKLAVDYAYDFPSLAPFFAGDPSDRDAWAATIARVSACARPTARLVDILEAQQRRRGAPDAALQASRRLLSNETVAIVTGQQAGLFGGPLYTLLKAITALKLAERISREHGVTAVPVFWVECEDHDWDEVRSCTVLDEALAPRTVSLPPAPASEPVPVARRMLDPSIETALDELERALPSTEFRSALVADLRSVYAPGAGMADAFARWLERTLGPHGLVVFDGSDPRAKPLASAIFIRELSAPGDTSRRAAQAGAELSARGYHSQVQGSDDGVALFRMNGIRQPIHRDGSDFIVAGERVAPSALTREASEHPELFSPNVLLRPIVQDTIFPTICYVAGPNELAYLGQLRGVYEHFNLPMPLVLPRATATLLDSAGVRFLTKYNVALESLQPQDEKALNELLKTQIPPAIEESFTAAAGAIDGAMTRVTNALPLLDPTLEGAAKSTVGRMQHDLQTLHGKMIQTAKRRDETLRRQYLRTRALAFPDGHPQERTIAFVSFLNQYGPALVDRLYEELPLDAGHHWILSI
jgi:bacillithiol biosynthesis cysteine-adding enzyme BshC